MINRREFLKASTVVAVTSALSPKVSTFGAEIAAAKPRIRKAIMWATVGMKGTMVEKMKAIKEAGFEGVEMISHMNQDDVLRARDEVGLQIPSVCGKDHW